MSTKRSHRRPQKDQPRPWMQKRKEALRKAQAKNKAGERISAAQRLALDFDQRKFQETGKYLNDTFGIDLMASGRPEEFWARLSEGAPKLVRVSRQKYLEVLSGVAATYVEVMRSPNRVEVLHALAAHHGITFSKKTDPLALIARAAIKYGDNGKDNNTNRKLWARDAAAIWYLLSQGLAPHEFVARQQEIAGGLDQWAREWYRRKTDRRGVQQDVETAAAKSVGALVQQSKLKTVQDEILRQAGILTTTVEAGAAAILIIGTLADPPAVYTRTIELPATWPPQQWDAFAETIRKLVGRRASKRRAPEKQNMSVRTDKVKL